MRKIVLIMSCFILAFTLYGCGSSKENSTATSEPTAAGTAKATEGAAAEPAKIKFYTFKTNKAEEPVFQAVKAFNELQKDVEVEYVSLVQNSDSVEFMTKLDVLIAGGETIDVFMTGNEDQLLERAARGVVEPLDSFYATEGVTPADEYFKSPTIDGKTYGIITGSTQWLTVFNKDHLDAAKLTLPEMGWTWDDFRDYAKKLTTADHYGTYFHTWGEYPNIIAYTERPNPQLKADLTPNFDDPSFKYFFNLRRVMEKEDKSVEPYADVLAGNYHVLQQFFAGNASMLAVPSYVVRAGLNLEKFPHDFTLIRG
ncbi:MAG: extracellular solute-binding protein [Gorillibacterium sp.]|nr:extracellular solute-binding protein [Gorillibacterium sp.]